jgi:hypothetical protein
MIRTASNLVALTVVLAISFAWSAAAAETDKFCAQIGAIFTDASNGFVALRGQQTRQEKQEATSTDPTNIVVDHYAASGMPEGAIACEITANDSANSQGRRHPRYSCEFPITGNDKGAAIRKLANRTAACLPGFSRPIGPGLNKDGGTLSAHASDYSVDLFLISGPASSTIELSIESNWK